MSNDAIQKALESQLKNIADSTGKSLDAWKKIINDSGLQKHGELVNMLKANYAMGHGNANTLVHYAKQSHADAADSETDWLEEQYKGKENLRPLYDKLARQLEALGKDVEFSPKKAYMSIRRKKQFAIIQPSTKARMDIGLNMKGVAPSGMLEASGSWNAMCTHRIKLEENATVTDDLMGWIKQAYEQAG